jgi:hypothetical protein
MSLREIDIGDGHLTMGLLRARTHAHVVYLVQWMEDGATDVEALSILEGTVEYLKAQMAARGGKAHRMFEVIDDE